MVNNIQVVKKHVVAGLHSFWSGAFRRNLLIVSWATPTPGYTANFPHEPLRDRTTFKSLYMCQKAVPAPNLDGSTSEILKRWNMQ
jgi:hypothetical protein